MTFGVEAIGLFLAPETDLSRLEAYVAGGIQGYLADEKPHLPRILQ